MTKNFSQYIEEPEAEENLKEGFERKVSTDT